MDIFEYATRKPLRFSSSKGELTTEQLWKLPLVCDNGGACLRDIAINLKKQLENPKIKLMQPKQSEAVVNAVMGFDVVIHIINVRSIEAHKAVLESQKVAALLNMDIKTEK